MKRSCLNSNYGNSVQNRCCAKDPSCNVTSCNLTHNRRTAEGEREALSRTRSSLLKILGPQCRPSSWLLCLRKVESRSCKIPCGESWTRWRPCFAYSSANRFTRSTSSRQGPKCSHLWDYTSERSF